MKEKQLIILQHVLQHVAFDGWNKSTLCKSSQDAGFEPNYALIAFKKGENEAISLLMQQFDDKMAQQLATMQLEDMTTRMRIFTAVKIRLNLYATHKAAIRKTVSHLSLPYNVACGTKSLWRTVDTMWHAAGDNATDFNYYTKRLLLAGVYSSTLLYWLDDNSKDQQDSWNFLQRRIDNVMLINKAKSILKDKCLDVKQKFGS